MAEIATTAATSTAPAPAPTVAPQPAAQPASRPGTIPREQYDGLPEDRKAAYAHVSRPGGGMDYVERSKLPSESGADPAAADATTTPTLAPGEKYKFGDLVEIVQTTGTTSVGGDRG